MQLSTFETLHDWNFTDKNVMIGLSGGINSAAVLCYLVKHIQNKPKKLFLYHADFAEHSPDTLPFVHACIEYAEKHFDVEYEIHSKSALDFFKESKMIPAPTLSPCTRILKIEPMVEYMRSNNIDVDLVGYVRTEDRRIINQIARKIGIKRKVTKGKFLAIQQIIDTVELLTSEKDKADFKERLSNMGVKNYEQARNAIKAYRSNTSHDGKKAYPIKHMTDNDCFSLVKDEIGWFPKLYSFRWDFEGLRSFLNSHEKSMTQEQYKRALNKCGTKDRVFAHNNCLPCKNMQSWEFLMIKFFYPEYYNKAIKLQQTLPDSVWGRAADKFMASEATCSFCAFD